MKLKALSAALLLAAGAGAASNAVASGSVGYAAPSDLILAIIDNTAGANYGKTFLLNTGLDYVSYANGTATEQVIRLDQKGYTFGNDSVSVALVGSWALDFDGLSNADKSGQTAPYSAAAPYGSVTSSGFGAAGIVTEVAPLNNQVGNWTDSASSRTAYNLGVIFSAFSSLTTAGQSTTISPTTDTNQVVHPWYENLVTFDLTPAGGQFQSFSQAHNSLLNLFFATSSDLQTVQVTQTAGLRLATQELPITAVPVPAAFWLLGSALLGMGTIARRGNIQPANA